MRVDIFTGGLFQTNGYLLTLPEGQILVDAPEGVADWLDRRGARPGVLLLTHQHHDHVVDAAAVRSRFGCPLWACSPRDPGLTLESLLQDIGGFDFTLEPFPVDRLLESESAIRPAGIPLRILHVPGHSPDSLCFHWQPGAAGEEAGAAGSPLLFGGDVLFRGSIGRTDFPHGDHELLLAGIRKSLYTLPGDTRVFPGHGPETSIALERATNPFVPG